MFNLLYSKQNLSICLITQCRAFFSSDEDFGDPVSWQLSNMQYVLLTSHQAGQDIPRTYLFHCTVFFFLMG